MRETPRQPASFQQQRQGQAPREGREGLAVRTATQRFKNERVQRLRRTVCGDRRAHAGCLDPEAAEPHAFEDIAWRLATGSADRAGWGKGRRERRPRRLRLEDEHRDEPPGAVERECARLVIDGSHVEDHPAVCHIRRMAVTPPAARPEVNLDIAPEEVPAGVEDCPREIRPRSARGRPREDDPQATAILEAKRAGDPRRPACRERGLGE
ncbi:MAG: hypothetical protein M5U18_08520 [Dehalococcoidia bacterium]|nr:hypothetical protein [Dehalococcoidia bacterium]